MTTDDEELRVATRSLTVNGTRITILTCLDGKYVLWRRERGRYRWALREWPDDGLGIRTHGAGEDLVDAVQQCHENHRLRKEVHADLRVGAT